MDSSFVVSGHTVLINDDTEYEVNDENVTNEQFWALVKVGDQVKVKGNINDEGVITAKKVELEIEHQDNVAEVELQASGELIDNGLTVARHSIEFDENTHFKGNEGNIELAEFLAQATQWQNFKVKGILRENVIFARKIEQADEDEDSNKIELSAFIEAFIDNGITVAGHEVLFTDATTFSVGEDGEVNRDVFTNRAEVNAKVKIRGSLVFTEQSDGSVQESITADKVELKMHN